MAMASEHATEAQFQAHGQARPQIVQHQIAGTPGAPHIAPQEATQVEHIALIGRLVKPHLLAQTLSCSAVAKLPRRMSAGSPGISMVSTNMTRLAPSSVGMMSATRQPHS